jgi:galactonate dehydratase
MYANINRRTEDRTPEGFAASARDALAQGYLAVKIAPFDNVVPQELGTTASRALIDAGIARIHATRKAIGPNTVLMVDCHWRFDEKTAASVLRELESAKLFWFECPIGEGPENYAALKRLRKVANRTSVRLAGAEQQIGIEGFRPFVEGGLYDVVMPDVKYAGGYSEMLRIADLCQKHSVAFSPHNPTGPVCTLASLHVCALAQSFLLLEHQLGESPLYYDLVRGGHPRLGEGCFGVPNVPGLGIDLDEAVMRAHPYQPLTNVRDSRLG